jgi:hypothetical protein
VVRRLVCVRARAPLQDLNVQKLLRGSKVDTLELLQYLHKYLKREHTVCLCSQSILMR